MTIRFKASWNGYEQGTIATLTGPLETSLIAANIATNWAINQEQRSDRAAVIRYSAAGVAQGIVTQDAAGAEVVVPISGGAGGASAFSALTDAASAPIATTNTSVAAVKTTADANTVAIAANATAIAGKVNALAAVDLGAGAVTLVNATHANRPLTASPTGAVTYTYPAAGNVTGNVMEVLNTGSAVITHSVTAATGYTTTQAPGTSFSAEFNGAAWISVTPSAVGGGVPAPVTVAGSTVNGSVLTATIGAGWVNTGGNWTRDGANIAGATALTYTTAGADGGHSVTYASTNLNYIPQGIAVAASLAANPRLVTLAGGVVESGSSGAGYSYALSAGGGWSSSKGYNSDKSLPADGYLQAVLAVANGAVAAHAFGVATDNTGHTVFEAVPLMYTGGTIGTNALYYFAAGNSTGYTALAGDIMRWTRVGTAVTFQVARAGSPTAFVDVHAGYTLAGSLYPWVNFDSPAAGVGAIGPITGSGLA